MLMGLVALSGLASVTLAILMRPRTAGASPTAAGGQPVAAPAVVSSADPLPAPSTSPAKPAPANPGLDAQSMADFDRGIVAGLESTLSGTLESYDFLRAWVLKKPEEVAASQKAWLNTYAGYTTQLQAEGVINAERAKAAQDILGGLSTASLAEKAGVSALNTVLGVVGSVPGIGSAINGVFQIVSEFVKAAAEAAAAGKSMYGGIIKTAEAQPLYFGYLNGSFYFWDVPVWSFTVPMWITEFHLASGPSPAWALTLQAFKNLAMTSPLGYPTAWVRIELDGTYTYRFNVSGNGDISDAASSRAEVKQFSVWNPLDVTAKGPRGFDPANPWSWQAPGLAMSRFDLPSQSAAGIQYARGYSKGRLSPTLAAPDSARADLPQAYVAGLRDGLAGRELGASFKEDLPAGAPPL